MNIVYVNDNDLAGRRFNGHDLQIMLNKNGHNAKQFVVSKAGSNENTIPMIKTQGGFLIRELCKEFESRISMQSIIFPFGEILAESEEFKKADVVHYHLLFNYFMSLYSFKKLTLLKPSVWTFHDPWALTGHCVHPVECKGWLTGCKDCPHLDRYAPLREDHAASIWNIKKDIYNSIDIDIVVASKWMYDMVKTSPLTKHFERVHLIPFGIDIDLFKKRENKIKIQNKLGIKKGNSVIMFRQDDQEWKGLPYIEDMLESLKSDNSITILTVGRTGLLDKFKKRYQIIEYDWVNDNDLMIDLYSASDLFLMPSVAESFGLMAVEAMSCSLPIIVFEGTALPSITFSPKCGISLKKGDSRGFCKIVERLIKSPKEREDRGLLGRKLVEDNYNVKDYNHKMIKLYEGIYEEREKNSNIIC